MLTYFLEAVGPTWALLAGAAALAVYWARSGSSWDRYNIPPFPEPGKPLLGHVTVMKGDPRSIIAKMRAKVGDVFSLNMAGKLIVVVNGYDNIRQVLVKGWGVAADRPVDVSSQVLGEENHGLLTSRGANWKEQRTTSLNILRAFGMGKNIAADNTAKEVAVYTDKLASFKGEATNVSILTNAAVCNVICSIIVGKRFDYEDESFVTLMENMRVFVQFPSPWLLRMLPVLEKLPWDFTGVKFWAENVRGVNENFGKVQINAIKKEFSPDVEPDNFISAYLQELQSKQEAGKPTYLDEPNLISVIKSLFVAGTETISTTISWCVLCCLHHPQVQEKVHEEIKTHVGTDRAVSTKDVPRLPYFSAVIRESQRLGNVIPLLQRVVTDNFQLQGYTIPKGSELLINLTSALQDEHKWENPTKFCPERFLDPAGKLIKEPELIPFGLGRRICMGEALARMELEVFLAAMFQRFRFEPENASEELPLLEKGIFSSTFSPEPYKVRFVEREG